MARRPGKRYPLIVYRHMLNRWWTPTLAIGLVMFILAYSEYIQMGQFIPWRWMLPAAVGVLGVFVGILFFAIRFMAYVQPYPDHLKFVTPFLRMNISYRRIRRTTTTEMRMLFPLKSLSGWVQDIFSPLASKTALVIDLSAYPISAVILRLFLSRFFFKDKTPHLVILVEDWLRFSSEMESMRTGTDPEPAARKPKDSILSRLSQK